MLRTMLHACLTEKNVERTLSFCADDIYVIGTNVDDVSFHKDELRDNLTRKLEDDSPAYQVELLNWHAKPLHDDLALLVVDIQLRPTCITQQTPVILPVRLTASAQMVGTAYQVLSMQFQLAAAVVPISHNISIPAPKSESVIYQNMRELINSGIPGGILGGYIEPGYPLYWVNEQMLDFLGFTYDEFLLMTGGLLKNAIHPDDFASVDTAIKTCTERGGRYEVRCRLRRKDGSYPWVLSRGWRMAVEEGREVVMSVCVDVTQTYCLQKELKEKNQLLQRKNQELEALTNSIPGAVCKVLFDDTYSLLDANDAFYEMCGYTPEQMQEELGNSFSRAIYTDDVQDVKQTILQARNAGDKYFEFEKRVLRRNGALMWVLVRGTFVFHTDQTVLNCVVIDITSRKQMEQELQLNEKRLRVALMQTASSIFDYDLDAKTLMMSERLSTFYAVPQRLENVPQSLIDIQFVHPDYAQPLYEMFQKIEEGEPSASSVVKARLAQGGYGWTKIVLTPILNEKGRTVRAVGMIEDISRQKETELMYHQGEQYRAVMLAESEFYLQANLTENIVEVYQGKGFSLQDKQNTFSYDRLIQTVAEEKMHPDDRETYRNLLLRGSLLRAFQKGKREFRIEHRRKNQEGQYVWMLTTMFLIHDTESDDIKGLAYIKNIDEQKKKVLRLQYKSERDSLTALYNKSLTESLIRLSLGESSLDVRHVFFIIDVDDFKSINDRFGHLSGDRVLAQAAKRLSSLFRSGDVIGRIGGDEFVVFAKNIPTDENMEQKAQRILQMFREPFVTEDARIQLSCSIGIAVFARDGASFEELYRNADVALYEAKKNGRDQYVYYQAEMLDSLTQFSRTAIDSDTGAMIGDAHKLISNSDA